MRPWFPEQHGDPERSPTWRYLWWWGQRLLFTLTNQRKKTNATNVFVFFFINDDEDMIKPVRIRCVGTFDYGKQQRALCYSDKDNQKVQLTLDIIVRFFKISYLFIEIVSSLDQHLSLNLLRTCAVQSVGRIYIYYWSKNSNITS